MHTSLKSTIREYHVMPKVSGDGCLTFPTVPVIYSVDDLNVYAPLHSFPCYRDNDDC